MKTTPTLLASLLMLALIGVASPALASGWGSTATERALTMSELIPRMSSGQAYSERYSFAVDFDDGGHVGINFTISNLGVRSGYGASEVRVRLPDHDNHRFAERYSRGDWSYDPDSFGLEIGPSSIKASGEDAFDFVYRGDDVEVELRFELQMPMWRPGSGEIRSGDDYYRYTLVGPRSNVSGRIKIDGQWKDVTGTRRGYADHVATNVAPFDLGKRFTRFRNYNDDAFIMWREIGLTEAFGGGTASWVVVGVGDRIVYQDANADVRFGELERDDETGYLIPHATQVTSQQGDDRLRFVLRGNDVNRRDLLASYGRVGRAVASRFSEPYEYVVAGDYTLEVLVGGRPLRLRGSSHVTVDHVNR